MILTKAQTIEMRSALHEVIESVNNNSDIARACGVSPQAVNGWIVSGKAPARHVAKLIALAAARRLTISAARLRPDIFALVAAL